MSLLAKLIKGTQFLLDELDNTLGKPKEVAKA